MRRFRSSGGTIMRRLGLLPKGQADGLGDDAHLLGTSLTKEIVVYFPSAPMDIARIEVWYETLAALSTVYPVLVIAQDSRTARHIRQDSSLDVVTIAHYGTLDDLLGRSGVRMAIYVDHHPWNFSMLRFTSLVHVALLDLHRGAIDLETNQVKAYDFVLTTDQSATERIAQTQYAKSFSATVRNQAEDPAAVDTVIHACKKALKHRDVEWARVQNAGAVGP